MRKLGKVQAAVLEALERHGSWSPRRYGWLRGTESNTLRIIRSLVRAGRVAYRRGVYRPKRKP